jgi:hypothetical protein
MKYADILKNYVGGLGSLQHYDSFYNFDLRDVSIFPRQSTITEVGDDYVAIKKSGTEANKTGTYIIPLNAFILIVK